MADYIKEPNMYGGRYNGMDLATRTREYERDLYLYNMAKAQQGVSSNSNYEHLTMVYEDDDYTYDEEEFDEIDELKDKYMVLKEQQKYCEKVSHFTPIQDVDWCLIVLAYMVAMFTIPFESVSTPLAFIIATIITMLIVFGQKIYRNIMKSKSDRLKVELKQIRKELKSKEGR